MDCTGHCEFCGEQRVCGRPGASLRRAGGEARTGSARAHLPLPQILCHPYARQAGGPLHGSGTA